MKSEVHESVSADTDARLGRSNSTTSYRPDVQFRYSYRGRAYESDLLKPTIIVQGFASSETAAEELKPFPVGARVPAWVDPQNPDKAYLVQEGGAGPIVFIILGILLPPIAWVVGKYL